MKPPSVVEGSKEEKLIGSINKSRESVHIEEEDNSKDHKNNVIFPLSPVEDGYLIQSSESKQHNLVKVDENEIRATDPSKTTEINQVETASIEENIEKTHLDSSATKKSNSK